jgi:DASS family divalent anion:Na+ symporter
MDSSKLWRGIVVVLVGVVIWFLPHPGAVTPQAWHLFALTVAIILGFILNPMPIGAVAFIGITIVSLTRTLSVSDVVAGFGNNTMWLIVSAFIFSRAFLKTGLGQRIAYFFLRALGDSTLKVGYALVLSDLVLAPLTPSSGARAGAIMYPIVRGISTALGSEPGPTARRAGAYLIQCVYQCEGILCAMFMTAMAGNVLIVDLAQKTAGVTITWGGWLLASSVPAIICLALHPWLVYKLFPPELKDSPEAKALAVSKLNEMGPMSTQERILGLTFLVALILWCTSSYNKIPATTVAMAAVSALLLAKVIDWKDMLAETGAWDTLIWMGSLMALAGQLSKVGFIGWFATEASSSLSGVQGFSALLLLLVIYMYSHYGFASMTAHISAMYAAFVAVAVAAGAPPMITALSLGFTANLCLAITHYSGTASPMFFGPGFVALGPWWKLGFIFSIVNLAIWIGVGSMWWKVIGLW